VWYDFYTVSIYLGLHVHWSRDFYMAVTWLTDYPYAITWLSFVIAMFFSMFIVSSCTLHHSTSILCIHSSKFKDLTFYNGLYSFTDLIMLHVEWQTRSATSCDLWTLARCISTAADNTCIPLYAIYHYLLSLTNHTTCMHALMLLFAVSHYLWKAQCTYVKTL